VRPFFIQKNYPRISPSASDFPSIGKLLAASGVEEAQSILRYYRRIIRNIKKQLGEGGYLETDEDLHRNIS
jgi:hypothetical protein